MAGLLFWLFGPFGPVAGAGRARIERPFAAAFVIANKQGCAPRSMANPAAGGVSRFT